MVYFEEDDLSLCRHRGSPAQTEKKASLYPRFALFKISPWICVKRDKKDIENEGDVGYARCCIARREGRRNKNDLC